MKNIKVIILLFLIPTVSYCQTKQETEKWILEKLNKYSSSSIYESNFKFSFKNNTFIITYNYMYRNDIPVYPSYKEYTTNYIKEEVPINEITSINFNNEISEYHGQNRIDIKCNMAITSYCNNKKNNDKSDCMTIEIADNMNQREPDLEGRIKKAFEHLKTFCQQSKNTKETF